MPSAVLFKFSLLLAVPSLAFAQDVPGAFDFDVIPSFRATPTAQYAGWDVFTVPFAGVNLPDDTAADMVASIEQLSTSAIITSTMNIYNPIEVSEFVLDAAPNAPVSEVVLQLRSLGNPLESSSLELIYLAGGVQVAMAPTSSQVLNPSPGFAEENLFSWDFSSITDDVSTFQILFSAAAANFSLDAVMVDISSDTSIGAIYCSANANSTGSVGEMTLTGSPVATDNQLELVSTGLPSDAFGFYITSQVQDSVFSPAGSDGILCLGGDIGRFVSQVFQASSSGGNTTAIDLTQMPTPTGPVMVAAGETWNFQCWHRDANPAATSNFTLPVSLTFQ